MNMRRWCTPSSKCRRAAVTHRIFNAGNIFGAIAFLAMLAAPGAVEGGMYITAAVLVAIFAACAYLSIKENRKKR